MEVNADGVPTKDKMSKLTIAGEKGKGTLGEADLNLSEYQEGEFKIFKLPLKKCVDEDAYIEVGLRATEAKTEKKKTEGDEGGEKDNDRIMYLLDELDNAKKELKK